MLKENDEQTRMIIETISKFSREVLAPKAAEVDSEELFPHDSWKKLSELGFAGLLVDPAYNGMGLDYCTLVGVVEEIAKGCVSMAGIYLVHSTVNYYLSAFGSEDQKKHHLPTLADGSSIGAMCITEPGAGSDVSALRSSARREGDQYIINGGKVFITSGGEADLYIVLAKVGSSDGAKGLSTFIVEKDRPGLSFGKKEKKMGYGGSSTRQLIFEDCAVPHDHLLGKEGAGFKIMMMGLDRGRVSTGAMAVGLAQVAFDEAVDYARGRLQFGSPISQFQGIQWMFADMTIEIEAARLLVHRAAGLCDRDKPFTKEAAMAKCFASDAAMRVTTDVVQIYGGYGYMREYPAERHMREAKFMQIVEGTNQIQRNIIAREIFKGS
ncbi:acyl-CoA dehydrogenase family protein [Thermodesulfobacteriota bacterium]